MSCSSTGGTSLTPKAGVRNATSTASRRAWRPPACACPCSAPPTTGLPPRRSSRASASCAAAGASASTPGRCCTSCATGPAWSSTCRTACRSAVRLVTRRPVVVLVHHVHREQWPIVFGRIGGAVGWWIESVARAAHLPRLPLRHGVRGDRRGAGRAGHRRRPDHGRAQRRRAAAGRRVGAVGAAAPGRAGPARPAQARRARHRGARPAAGPLAGAAAVGRRRGLVGGRAARARPTRWVSPTWWTSTASSTSRPSTRSSPGRGSTCARRSRRAGAWWSPRPAAHRVPTVGYRAAGGLRESVLDGRTGVLVDDLDELTEAVDRLLADGPARRGWARPRPVTPRRTAGRRASGASPACWPPPCGDQPRLPYSQDVDRLLVALLDGCPGPTAAWTPTTAATPSTAPSAERQQRSDERLHSVTRFRRGRRRRVTVEAPLTIHNTAPTDYPERTGVSEHDRGHPTGRRFRAADGAGNPVQVEVRAVDRREAAQDRRGTDGTGRAVLDQHPADAQPGQRRRVVERLGDLRGRGRPPRATTRPSTTSASSTTVGRDSHRGAGSSCGRSSFQPKAR